MSSGSGITATPELVERFAQAVTEDNVRVLKISIENETLVEAASWPKARDLIKDFEHISGYVEDNVSAYLLVRLDTVLSEWLVISYVPDTARVRDKMLYASTQAALKKSLGDSKFKDSMYATSKADLTPDAYVAHLNHMSAPKPLSAREEEMANIRAAERAAGSSTYQGSGVRKSHVHGGLELQIPQDIQDALKGMSDASGPMLVIVGVDTQSEQLILKQTENEVPPERLASVIPSTDPSYIFYSWPHESNGETIRSTIYIYCCPSGSPVRHRMLYSAGVQPLAHKVKQIGLKIDKKSETSEPEEINEAWLLQELRQLDSGLSTPASTERIAFAKPRGPPRRR